MLLSYRLNARTIMCAEGRRGKACLREHRPLSKRAKVELYRILSALRGISLAIKPLFSGLWFTLSAQPASAFNAA
jgi:hypothetical protein